MMINSIWLQVTLLSSIVVTTFGGGCLFPSDWSGRWFQSGLGPLTINSTYFGLGECVEKSGDKYVVTERSEKDPCTRCIAVYKRHDNVIQYKEGNCLQYMSLEELCMDITGDQPLLSLFRAENASSIPCPFKSPPYKFSYNRGSGDCSLPVSRIDSCTDDSRLLVYFAACTDIPGTESGVEVLNCLATWKEGNSKYLVAKITKEAEILSEENSYRCFMYTKKSGTGSELTYQVAQSGDATCQGLTSPIDGSRTMLLTRIENSHERCKFPSWVVDHHHWISLDGGHAYHFSHKNATLRVTREHGPTEMRLVCHHVVTNTSSAMTLVAHATAGCKNGHICMVFHKRDNGVIQLQKSNEMVQEPSEACIPPFDTYRMSSPVTLIVHKQLAKVKCPHAGHYTASSRTLSLPPDTDHDTDLSQSHHDCHGNTTLSIGCATSNKVITFQTCSPDTVTAFHCHGTWSSNGTTYVIVSPVSRTSTDAERYCLVLKQGHGHMSLYRLSDSCNLAGNHNHAVTPLNLTLQGSCVEIGAIKDCSSSTLPSVLSLSAAVLLTIVCRR